LERFPFKVGHQLEQHGLVALHGHEDPNVLGAAQQVDVLSRQAPVEHGGFELGELTNPGTDTFVGS